MKELRKLKRRRLLYNLKICDSESGEVAGWVADLNSEGMRMTGFKSYAAGSVLTLSIALPETLFEKQKIRFSAVVQWCKPDVNPDLIASGMQFTSIAPDDLETLVAALARYSLG